MPIQSDFRKGDEKFFNGGRETRRRQALKYKHSNKEELEKDSKRVSEIIHKMTERDDLDWSTYDKCAKERDDISKKYNNNIQYSYHRAQSKSDKRNTEFERHLGKMIDPLIDKYTGGNSEMSKEARAISDHRFRIIKQHDQLSKVELVKEIDSLKAEKEAFLKKYVKSSLAFEESGYFEEY